MRGITLIVLTLVPFLVGATDGGIQVSDDPPGAKAQLFPQVVKTGDGGCIIAWENNRNGRFGIRTQKLDSLGQRQWTSGDVYVTSDFTEGHITSLSMCADDDGGAYIAFAYWHDTDFKDAGVYIQHVTDSGQLWSTSVNLYPIDSYEDR